MEAVLATLWHWVIYLWDTEGDLELAEELNIFFARFVAVVLEVLEPQVQHAAHSSTTLTLEEHEVRRTLRAVNPRKAAGPEGVPGQILRDCAEHLAGIFTKSLAQAVVPFCLKSSTVVPLPKKPHVTSLLTHQWHSPQW